MDIAGRVSDYIRSQEMIRDGDTVIAGVSGGADSLGLLFLLHELEIPLHVVHVHHGIRGVSADEDEGFTLRICERLHIPSTSVHIDIPALSRETGESMEEAARRGRYRVLGDVAARFAGRARVAVAHHMDDQAETVLHNLIRGTGIGGLSGMRPVGPLPFSDGSVSLIRPLLILRRSEIEDYLSAKGMSWRVDETNLTDDYTRNRIRHVIMPAMEQINPRSVIHITEAARRMYQTSDFLERECRRACDTYIEKEGECICLDTAVFEKEHPVIASMVVRECISRGAGALKDITSTHVDDVRNLSALLSGKKIDLPYGICVKKNYDRLIFEKEVPEEEKTEKEPEEGPFRFAFREFEREVTGEECDFPKDSCIKWFDCDKINGCATWRHRQPGDYIVTAAGTVMLQDFFINQKLEERKRDGAWLLTLGSEVLWVYAEGLSRMNVNYMTDKTTKKIMEASIKYERKD